MSGTPGDGLGAVLDIAHRDRQPRTAQPQVPAAEQAPAHQPRQCRVAPVDERSGPDHARRDSERGRFTFDELFLQTLAPGVGAERPRVLRPRCALVLSFPRCARWPQD